jgi:hexokinase
MNIRWCNFPTGNEPGTISTLDLGGTNLRICKVILHSGKEGKSEFDQEQYKLPRELKTSDAEGLWTFIAVELETLVEDRALDKAYS